MAKRNYVVLRSGTYGKRGEVIERDFGKDGLSDRQGVLLKLYKKPVITADNSVEVKTLTKENEDLKLRIAELTKPKEPEKQEPKKEDKDKDKG